MEKLRILFTGDSITDVNRTDMVRMTEEWMSRDPNATPQQREEAVDRALGCGYPLLVASQLGAQEPGRYEFLNRGISGNRVVDLDARIKRDCINLRPDVISILIGVNDVWHELGEHNGVDAPKFRRVYEGMLQEITHALPGVKLILLEPYVLQGPRHTGALGHLPPGGGPAPGGGPGLGQELLGEAGPVHPLHRHPEALRRGRRPQLPRRLERRRRPSHPGRPLAAGPGVAALL